MSPMASASGRGGPLSGASNPHQAPLATNQETTPRATPRQSTPSAALLPPKDDAESEAGSVKTERGG